MFASVRGIFLSDASDAAPEPEQQPGASSTSSDTQDTFAPVADEPDGDPSATTAAPSAAAAGPPGAPRAAGAGRRGGGLRGVGGAPYRAARGDGDLFAAEPLFQEDEGTDTGGAKRRRPLAQRADVAVVEGGRAILTLGDAVDHVTGVMERQIERGDTEGFKPNTPITGDGAARTTFYTLLPDSQQREVFIKIAGQMRNWPRLRALFGAPPYNFLKSEDSNMLRAAGIASGRSSMSYEDSQSAANYTQFGAGQLMDLEEREYRVVPSEFIRPTDPAPWLLDVAPGREILLQVRVKKRDRKRKIELLRDSDARKTLTFPRAGDKIALSLTTSMLSIQRRRNPNVDRTTLIVRRVVPRGESAATAAVVAQLA